MFVFFLAFYPKISTISYINCVFRELAALLIEDADDGNEDDENDEDDEDDEDDDDDEFNVEYFDQLLENSTTTDDSNDSDLDN